MSAAFDDSFACPADWGRMYRSFGIQIVPCYMPSESVNWKRPALANWVTLQHSFIPEAAFERWYGPRGEHFRRINMGMLTGACSGGKWVLDLDDHKTPQAALWWRSVLEANNNGIEPFTWQQRTGGGGRQLVFGSPAGWHPPTNKTSIGVDIRGQGGFAVLPPSLHDSKNHYEWLPDQAPWETPVAEAPLWLCQAVDQLIVQHGGGSAHREKNYTAGHDGDFNAFGQRHDGREDYMMRLIWATLVSLHAECPIPPSSDEMEKAYQVYERSTKSRIFDPTVTKRELLEREGRGYTLFAEKWRRALEKWGDELANEAAQKTTSGDGDKNSDDEWGADPKQDESTTAKDPGPFPASDLSGTAPERKWVIEDWIAEGVVNSLYGQGGVGKTLLAQQLAYCLASGKPFLGLPVEKKKVMCVLCEDDRDEIHRRHDAIKKGLGITIGNPFSDVMLWPRVGYDNILVTWDKDGVPQVSDQFRAVLDAVLLHRPSLLVLDTLADMYGGNEIVRVQVNHFVKTVLGRLILEARRNGLILTVLLLAHPSTAGVTTGTGLSGSTAWENSVRSRLYLRFPEEGAADERELVRAKANYAKSGEETTLRLLWHGGMFVVAKGDPPGVRSAKNHIRGLVESAFRGKRGYTSKKGHERYIYAACVKAAMGLGVSKTNALQAIRELIEDGEIYVGKGTKGARGYRLSEGFEDENDE